MSCEVFPFLCILEEFIWDWCHFFLKWLIEFFSESLSDREFNFLNKYKTISSWVSLEKFVSVNELVSYKLSKLNGIMMVIVIFFSSFFLFFFLKLKYREKNSLHYCLRTRDKTNLKPASPGSSKCDSYCVDSLVELCRCFSSLSSSRFLIVPYCPSSVFWIYSGVFSFILMLIICDVPLFKNQYR